MKAHTLLVGLLPPHSGARKWVRFSPLPNILNWSFYGGAKIFFCPPVLSTSAYTSLKSRDDYANRATDVAFYFLRFIVIHFLEFFSDSVAPLNHAVNEAPIYIFVLQDSSPLRWSLERPSTRPAFSGVQTAANGVRACSTTTCLTGICTWAWPSSWRAWPSSSTPPRGIAYAGTTRSTLRDTRATPRRLSFTRHSQKAPNWRTGQSLYITSRTMSFVKIWSPFYSLLLWYSIKGLFFSQMDNIMKTRQSTWRRCQTSCSPPLKLLNDQVQSFK